MKKSALLTSLLTVFSLSFFVPRIKAQELSLVVSPPRFDIDGKPGETIQKTIKVTNNSESETVYLKAYVIDFIVEDDAGTPVKVTQSASGKYFASPWFALDQSEITIAPKTTEQFTAIITIPSSALPGGHYAGVFFEPNPKKGTPQTVSYTTTQVGSLFGITIAGNIRYDALIKDFSVKSKLVEFGPIDFATTIENQSDTHISPKSKIVIEDMIGRTLTELKLDDVNIFPFTTRSLKSTWDNVWGFGRYSATLSVVYGPSSSVATRTLYFWIMPYRLIAAILVVLLVVLVTYILVRRHLKSQSDHRDDEIDELKRKIIEIENRSR